MSRKTNKAARVTIRLLACVLIGAVLLATCLIPSRTRAQENRTADFIDRVFLNLTGAKASSEEFDFWYRNLDSGRTTAASMIDMEVGKLLESQPDAEFSILLDQISMLMTDHPMDEGQKETYSRYLSHGVSVRRVIADLAATTDYFSVCYDYQLSPDGITDLEVRDQDPSVTMYVYELLAQIVLRREVTASDCNEWCVRFQNDRSIAETTNEALRTGALAKKADGTEMSEEEILELIYPVLTGQEIAPDQKQVCLDALDNGMSMSYVLAMICETYAYIHHVEEMGLLPGEVELTEPRDANYEVTGLMTRLYSSFTGVRPSADELNTYVLSLKEDPGLLREAIANMLTSPECQELIESDKDFLVKVYEVFYDRTPSDSEIESYLIGLSHGITRERVLAEILKDPAFDEKMAEYGIDSKIIPQIPEKIIALTFDDGPYTPVTMRILDALEPYGAHATFFVVGNRVNNYSECIIRETNLGCEIGDHTWSHQTLTKLSADGVTNTINQCADAVYELTGIRPQLMRPCGGSYNNTVSANVGMPMILWSIDTNDWKYKDSNHVINEVLNYAKDGDIVLMHDLYETTADAVEVIVPALVEQGYTLVTVSELAEYKQIQMEKGKAYFSMRG